VTVALIEILSTARPGEVDSAGWLEATAKRLRLKAKVAND
jgi:hypothetical protein